MGKPTFSVLTGWVGGLHGSARDCHGVLPPPSPLRPSPFLSGAPWHLEPEEARGPLASSHPSLCSLGSEQSFWIHFSQQETEKTLR